MHYQKILIVAAVCSVVLFAQTADANEHLKKEVSWWVGTWDVSGKRSSGEAFKGEQTWRWVLGGQFLAGIIKAEKDGKLVEISRTMVGWDASAKEVRGNSYWHDGVHATFRVSKNGTSITGKSVDADGSKETFEGTVKLAKDKISYEYEEKVTDADGSKTGFTQTAKRRE